MYIMYSWVHTHLYLSLALSHSPHFSSQFVSLLLRCFCTSVTQWVSLEWFTGSWAPCQWLYQWKQYFSPSPTPQINHYLHANPEGGREPHEPFPIAWQSLMGPVTCSQSQLLWVMPCLEISIPHPPPPSFRPYILSPSSSTVFPVPSRGWYECLIYVWVLNSHEF